MITFIIGLVILIIGGIIYGRVSERIMAPTDATTPAVARRDNMDFVPIKKRKNCLIELLNIAGSTVWTDCVYHHTYRMCDRRSI